MRARTPMLALFFLLLAPASAHAAPVLISGRTDITPPFIRATGSTIPLSDSQFFVASGTLSDILVVPVSRHGLTGTERFYMQLFAGSNADTALLDCKTPIKSADEWGIAHDANDPAAPTVDFGPFTGTQCAINTASSTAGDVSAGLYADDGSPAYLRSVGWQWNGNGFNFAAYAGGAPTTDPLATAASSILFIPGMKGSRLYTRTLGIEHEIWEPSTNADIAALSMEGDGTSANQVYTKDIVDSIYSNEAVAQTLLSIFSARDLDVYGGFEEYLEQLRASGSLKEWRAYPYDWRRDVLDIVRDGTLTEEPDGSLESVRLADVLAEMASSSPTGKVTIVAHSNGGLLAKALASSLGAEASQYIDRIILVGTPQFGTPSSIGALLHGDGQEELDGLVVDSSDARAAAITMPGAYGLLPSAGYFSRVADPPVSFDASGAYSGAYAKALGDQITGATSFANFLTDASSISAQTMSLEALDTPLALSSTLLARATAMHALLDTWSPPAGIALTEIVGWGQYTVKTLNYSTDAVLSCTRASRFSPVACANAPELAHEPFGTQDGDGVVIDASAAGATGQALYFNARALTADGGESFYHQDLTSAPAIEQAITNLLLGNDPASQYLTVAKPSDAANPITLIESNASSVVATDSAGNESGVVPVPGKPASIKKQRIKGSSVRTGSDGTQTVMVPDTGSYKIEVTGSATGKTKIKITHIDVDGVASTTASYEDIPTTASSTITITIGSGVVSPPVVDRDGDGKHVYVYDPAAPAGVPSLTLIEQLEAQLRTIPLRPGISNRLLRAFEAIRMRQAAGNEYKDQVEYAETLVEAQIDVKLPIDRGEGMLELLDLLKL